MVSLGKYLYNSMKSNSSLFAIKDGARFISYDELNNKALAIGGFLFENGIKDENVGIITQRNFSAYAGILGVIYSGCTYVPINGKYPKEKITNIINGANIKVLISSEEDWTKIRHKIEDIDKIKFLLFPDGDNKHNEVTKSINNDDIDKITLLKEPVDFDNDKNVYIMFTSGSTGNPKGVEVSNTNVLCLLKNMKKYYDLDPGFRSSQTFDLSFDLSVSDMFFTWANGGMLCVLNENELYCPSEYINREKIEFWHSVPTLAEFMNRLGFLKPQMYPSLRYSIFCGEPLTQNVADAWMEAAPSSTIENLYGPTETTVFVSRYPYTKKDIDKNYKNNIVPIGRPFDGIELALIDGNNKLVPNLTTGELVICGKQVTKGYMNDDKKTSETFTKMPWDSSEKIWYKTGDLAFINSDGIYEYISRKDNQIKIAGRRIEVSEVESALRGKIKNQDAVVVPYRDGNGIVQYLVAYVNVDLTVDDIKTIKKDSEVKLESLFFPKKFIFLKNIPTTASGKIDRVTLERDLEKYI